jgi:hypothetical protein
MSGIPVLLALGAQTDGGKATRKTTARQAAGNQCRLLAAGPPDGGTELPQGKGTGLPLPLQVLFDGGEDSGFGCGGKGLRGGRLLGMVQNVLALVLVPLRMVRRFEHLANGVVF